jgi:excisionase family DNA binding protein
MEELVTLEQAAKLLKLHRETLRRWDRQGKLKAVKVGSRGDRRYRKEDIEKILLENSPQPQQATPVKTQTEYIQPKVKIHDDFKKAEEDRGKYGFLYLGNDVIDALSDEVVRSRSFVLAEAGFGKSRLLAEATNKIQSEGELSIIADLKLFAQSEFTTLHDYLVHKNPKLKSFLQKSPSNLLICLDALDEVKASDFDITVDRIMDFLKSCPEVSVLISCRWHFYKKREQDFNKFDFSVVTIMPFGNEEISKFLDLNGISEKDKGKIFDILSSPGRELIIKTPRYLELLVEYIKEHGVNQAAELKRSDLIDYFIYQKLNLEDKRLNAERRDMFKKVLESLALVMEINQTNVISKEEFMTFLGDVDSSFTKALIDKDLLSIFYEKSLLVDNDKTIEFENTEFQEYLAAKHICTLGQPFHNLYDFVVEERIREIHPSWFSTLGYLVEIDPQHLEPLLAFGKTNHRGIVEDGQYHRLLTKFNLDKLSQEKKIEIFDHVFLYYQNVLNWIGYEIARNLAYYYVPSLNNKLKSYVEKTKFASETEKQVQLGNVALVVGSIKKLGLFTSEEEKYWKDKLLGMIVLPGGNGVLQRHCLDALEQYKDESLIDKVIFLQSNEEKLVREQLIDFCIAVNPNHSTSVKLFLKTLQETYLVGGYQGLQKLNTKDSLLQMMDSLLADENLLKVFLDRDKSLFDKHKSDKILENLGSIWDEELREKVERLIFFSFSGGAWHFADRSHFTIEASELINSKKPGFTFRLLEECKKEPKLANQLFYLQNIFAALLQLSDVGEFVKKMSELEHGARIALWTLRQISFSKRSDAKKIYEEGRKYFAKEYEEIEKQESANAGQHTREKDVYKEFKFKLMPEEGKYMSDVFDYFNHSEEEIKKHWTAKDKDRLIELMTGSIFDKFDPKGQKVTITKIHDGSKTYTMHPWIHIFGECLEIARKINLDISKYRKKIVAYIPFAAYENTLSEILDYLGDLSDEEVKEILDVYKSRESDLWKFSPRSLIEIAKLKNLSDAIEILKSFVMNDDFHAFERTEALEAIAVIGEDEKYFISLFKESENKQNDLAEIANKVLITQFNNTDAIKWRFKQIELRAKPFTTPEGAHSVGKFESELHDKKFASPLLSLGDKYENDFLDLLQKSFKLLEKDKGYFEYVRYVWEIVYSYFEARKTNRSYQPLETLENFVGEHGYTEGANWFVSRLKELRKSYLLHIGKPDTFAESIGIYNKVKQRSYLPITTNEDLYQLIKQVINNEIQEYLYSEGSSMVGLGETNIQKQLQSEIQLRLLQKQERFEVTIIREPQSKDNTRCDYLIYYGWLGPILIELKLASHGDLKGKTIKSKTSHKRLKQYLTNYRIYKGILLVIDNERGKRGTTQYENVKDAYSDMRNVEVVWLKLSDD